MSYRTPEGRAAVKVADLVNSLEFSPAMFASCYEMQGEPLQERMAEIILAQIEHWHAQGYAHVTGMPAMNRLLGMINPE